MVTDIEIARAKRYKDYLLGWDYISLLDLPKYEKAYSKVRKEKKGFGQNMKKKSHNNIKTIKQKNYDKYELLQV